jgi:hypothetical protein
VRSQPPGRGDLRQARSYPQKDRENGVTIG